MAYQKKTYNPNDYTSKLSSADWTGTKNPTYSSETKSYGNKANNYENKYASLNRSDYESQNTKDAYSAYQTTMANQPGEYQDSDYLTSLKTDLQNVLDSKPSDFQYDSTALDEVYNKIMNRDDFEFDLGSSSLYQQYKDQYVALGQQAMADTMGQAAAMTGGYGSSYATSAGQQAYQQELQNLNDIVPQLYEQALNTYESEGNWLLNQYNTASSDRDFSYNNWRDTVADWQSDRSYAQTAMSDQQTYERNAYNSDYSNWLNTADLNLNAYNNFWNQDQTGYENDVNKYGTLMDTAYSNYWNSSDRDVNVWQQQNTDATNLLNFDEGVAEYNGNTKLAADQATEESAQAADDSQLGWSNYDLNYYDTHADNDREDRLADSTIATNDAQISHLQNSDSLDYLNYLLNYDDTNRDNDREDRVADSTIATNDAQISHLQTGDVLDALLAQNTIDDTQADNERADEQLKADTSATKYSNTTNRLNAVLDALAGGVTGLDTSGLGSVISGVTQNAQPKTTSSSSSSSSSYIGGNKDTDAYVTKVFEEASTVPVSSWSSTATSYYSKIKSSKTKAQANGYIKQAVKDCQNGKMQPSELKSIITDTMDEIEKLK